MSRIIRYAISFALLINTRALASSDDPFTGRRHNDPIKKEKEERVRDVLRVPNEGEPCSLPSSHNASAGNSSNRITMPAADIPVLDGGSTNHGPEQEYISEPSEIIPLGAFIHDLRNAAAILVSILDFDVSEIRSGSNGLEPTRGIIRDLINQANNRIIDLLSNNIMVNLRNVESQFSQHRVSRSDLTALMSSITDWLGIVRASQIPQIVVFMECLVDLERLTDDFSVYQTRHDLFRLSPTIVRLRELIQNISRLPFPQRHIDVDFRTTIAENVPNEIIADATRLRQTIINLLYNAFKFTRVGRVTLTAQLSPDHHSILFSVQDTGAGIAPEGIDRIFDPFVQDAASRASRTGLGLGLAIVKRLVGAFGGEIKVESTLGRGSTFYFTIPLILDLRAYKPSDIC